jgi:hypothetical protein
MHCIALAWGRWLLVAQANCPNERQHSEVYVHLLKYVVLRLLCRCRRLLLLLLLLLIVLLHEFDSSAAAQ